MVDYPDIETLQRELKSLGAANIASGRRVGLMSPAARDALNAASASVKRFVVTLELVQGHGWKGELLPSRNSSGDEQVISVDSLRGSWRRNAQR